MSETLNVSGPVKIVSDSTARVAYELMQDIANREYESIPDAQKKSREYWLTLYSQCWKAASGYSLESILKEE